MSITSANAVFLLSIPNLYTVPQQLQQFSADEIYATDPIESAEVVMGVDGYQSAGFVYVSVKQTIMLQADSNSVQIFDNWWASQQQAVGIYQAIGTITLPDVGKKFAMAQGVLTSYMPLPDAGRTLKPVKYMITWGRVIPSIITGAA